MFQYTAAYPTQGLNYAFICYLPSEQMYFLSASAIEPNYDLLPFNQSPQQQKNIQNPLIGILPPPIQISSPFDSNQTQNKSNLDFNLQKNSEENRAQPKQKFGRNICSNIFHLMVKFIKKQKKMKAVVARIIQQNNLTIKLNEFYQIFKNRSYKLKAYANISKISQFWKGITFSDAELNPKNIKQIECSKIFRIVSKIYLNYHHLPYVHNSMKIKSESKRLHMESIRKILSL